MEMNSGAVETVIMEFTASKGPASGDEVNAAVINLWSSPRWKKIVKAINKDYVARSTIEAERSDYRSELKNRKLTKKPYEGRRILNILMAHDGTGTRFDNSPHGEDTIFIRGMPHQNDSLTTHTLAKLQANYITSLAHELSHAYLFSKEGDPIEPASPQSPAKDRIDAFIKDEIDTRKIEKKIIRQVIKKLRLDIAALDKQLKPELKKLHADFDNKIRNAKNDKKREQIENKRDEQIEKISASRDKVRRVLKILSTQEKNTATDIPSVQHDLTDGDKPTTYLELAVLSVLKHDMIDAMDLDADLIVKKREYVNELKLTRPEKEFLSIKYPFNYTREPDSELIPIFEYGYSEILLLERIIRKRWSGFLKPDRKRTPTNAILKDHAKAIFPSGVKYDSLKK